MKKEKLDKFVNLIKENPSYEVLFMVSSDVVFDDGSAFYLAEIADVFVEELYDGAEYGDPEKTYIKDSHLDDLIEYMTEVDEVENAEEVVETLPWRKVIVAYLDPHEG